MYKHLIAYRHANNQVEGFVGIGFLKRSAERNAIARVIQKVQSIDNTYQESRLITSESQASPEEMEIIRADWQIDERPTFRRDY